MKTNNDQKKKKKKYKKPVLTIKKITQSEIVTFGTYGFYGPQFGS